MNAQAMPSRRPFLTRLAGATLLTAGLCLQAPAAVARTPAVAVVTIVEHPSLDAFRAGVAEALKEAGYESGKSLRWTYQSAQGNTGTAAQIARKFVGDEPDVIVAISTPAAQAVISATKRLPVVYGAVTDPVAAQLVKTMGPSGTNVTGVSDRLLPDRQVELIRKLLPNVRRVGMVYSPAEANSVVAVREMKEALGKQGIELMEVAAPRSVDVGQAARRLVGKVDLIYSSTDNNVVAAYEALVKVSNDARLPLVAADSDSARRGAVAALSINYRNLGRQAGGQVIKILKGEKPGNLASETSDNLELILNTEAARRQGVELSGQLMNEATEIVGR
ncbi:MAG: ABC transporter substrate-binding protein [Lautropia sp.]|nr:ABC transporter substrate-binding protein [Lautropia sp.]